MAVGIVFDNEGRDDVGSSGDESKQMGGGAGREYVEEVRSPEVLSPEVRSPLVSNLCMPLVFSGDVVEDDELPLLLDELLPSRLKDL